MKDEIKRIEYEKQRGIDETRKIERELQSDKAMILVEIGIQKEKISSLLKADEENVEEICKIRNMAIEERDQVIKEMAKLEGELEETWKILKNKEETENKSNKKRNSGLEQLSAT